MSLKSMNFPFWKGEVHWLNGANFLLVSDIIFCLIFIWCLHFFIVVTDALLTEVIVIVQFQVSIRFCQIFHLDHPVDSQRETDLKITFSPCFVWPKFPCTTKSEMLSQKIVTLSCLCMRVEECTILWLGSVPSSTQFQKTDASHCKIGITSNGDPTHLLHQSVDNVKIN